MRNSAIALLPLLFLLGLSPDSLAAEITWKVFLKSQPVYSAVTREGEELVLPRIILPGSASSAQEAVDALENTRILIPRLPDSRPVEIRIVLNISGSTFDPVRQKTMFLNMSVNPYRNGHLESPFTFSQPMTLTIPVTGLNSLLSLSGLNRNNITLAFDSGGAFNREGISSSNRTSGLVANILRLSTIVGSTCDLLNLPTEEGMSTWYKIKLMFR